jgi:preprotein translocase subunit SecD
MPTPDIRIALNLTALDGGELSSSGYEETVNILFNRAEALGTEFAGMRTDHPDRLIIQLSGVVNVDLAMTAITSRGLVELIDPEGELLEPGSYIVTSYGGQPWPQWDGQPKVSITGSFETIVSGEDITSASKIDGQLGAPVVAFELSDSGASALQGFTAENIGQPMAIVLDNRVVSSPVINGVIEKEGIIEGLTEAEVDALLIQLHLDPLRARIEVERYVINPALLGE